MGTAGIELNGFEEFFKMVEDMEITPEAEASAMRKTLNTIKKAVEPAAPIASGATKKSIKVKIKSGDFGTEGIIIVNNWAAQFQEWRNTMQKGKYIGWFERGVNASESEAINILRKELLK